jgi:hypothetical protein
MCIVLPISENFFFLYFCVTIVTPLNKYTQMRTFDYVYLRKVLFLLPADNSRKCNTICYNCYICYILCYTSESYRLKICNNCYTLLHFVTDFVTLCHNGSAVCRQFAKIL